MFVDVGKYSLAERGDFVRRRSGREVDRDAQRRLQSADLLRRWLYTFVTKPDDSALKKRWCPVYEVLFRAGAEVRPDWRDDPYAFMVDEFRGPICGFTEGSGEL